MSALAHFLVASAFFGVGGIIMDLLNSRLGNPLYSFPSLASYILAFSTIYLVFAGSYWLAHLILRRKE